MISYLATLYMTALYVGLTLGFVFAVYLAVRPDADVGGGSVASHDRPREPNLGTESQAEAA